MAEGFDLDKIKQESQMMDDWRLRQQQDLQGLTGDQVLPNQLNFPTAGQIQQKPVGTALDSLDTYQAPQLDPYTESSPYTVDINRFDPYQHWRSSPQSTFTDKSIDASRYVDTPIGESEGVLDDYAYRYLPILTAEDPVTDVPLEDQLGVSEESPEYQQWLNEYHPFDPEWRKAKGKWTPFQKDEELVIPTETEGRAADYLGPVEDPVTDVLPSQLEDIEGISEGEGAMYIPDRPSVSIEAEDPEYDMDIDIADVPEREFKEYTPFDQNLKDEMLESGKYDENLSFDENVKNFEDWKSEWHPFDPEWRKAKDKWTPAQDREARKQAEYQQAQDILRGVPQSEEENIEAMYPTSEGEGFESGAPVTEDVMGEGYVPTEEDKAAKLDIDEMFPERKGNEEKMKEFNQWDDNLSYEENLANYEKWESGWRPFDQDWRLAKDKHIFDPQVRGEQELKDANRERDQIIEQNENLEETNKNIELENTKMINKAKGELETAVSTAQNALNALNRGDHTDMYGGLSEEYQAAQKEVENATNNLNNFDETKVEGLQELKEKQEVPEAKELKDIKGTKEYKADQEKQAIARGEGYHPDNEEWREAKRDWDKTDTGDHNYDAYESANTKHIRENLAIDFVDTVGSDGETKIWNDADGDGIVDLDEMNWDQMSKEQRDQWNEYANQSMSDYDKENKKQRTRYGGYTTKSDGTQGEWKDKDYWRREYKQQRKDAREEGRGLWQPFSHEWRKAHGKFTLKPKVLADFETQAEYDAYIKERDRKTQMWANILKGPEGEFGGLAQMLMLMAANQPYQYQQYIGGRD